MSKVLSLRVPDELADWADSYAESRGVKKQELLAAALADFKESCERGVPDIKAQVAQVQQASRLAALAALQGVGNCPERPGELGHVWGGAKKDPKNPCTFCGMAGRAPHGPSKAPEEQEGFFAQATRERAELFGELRQPKSVTAWGKQS